MMHETFSISLVLFGDLVRCCNQLFFLLFGLCNLDLKGSKIKNEKYQKVKTWVTLACCWPACSVAQPLPSGQRPIPAEIIEVTRTTGCSFITEGPTSYVHAQKGQRPSKPSLTRMLPRSSVAGCSLQSNKKVTVCKL
jgi:hypothetical protein